MKNFIVKEMFFITMQKTITFNFNILSLVLLYHKNPYLLIIYQFTIPVLCV